MSYKMLITLLMVLPLVDGYWWKTNCRDCKLIKGHTEADKIQWKAFGSRGRAGDTHSVDIEQIKRNGMVLSTGVVCKTPCEPHWAFSVHGCLANKNEYQTCAPYNKDQYGRECARVVKDATIHGTYCYVKDGDKYWAHNGGSWGHTHFPLCVADNRVCVYSRDGMKKK